MGRKLAAGNWKMNGCAPALDQIDALCDGLDAGGDGAGGTSPGVDVLICPPSTLLHRMAERADARAKGLLAIGGQDCHPEQSGAHTGDLSAQMLVDAGASHVILGHSERRADHHETDDLVRRKARAAIAAGLTAVICLGETKDERDAGRALKVVGDQLAGSVPDAVTAGNLVVAYEPIWAIGTGATPTTAQIGEVHDLLRTNLQDRFGAGIGGGIRLLYGGSVKPANADEIFAVPNVDGALVGGASLLARDFLPIIKALEASS